MIPESSRHLAALCTCVIACAPFCTPFTPQESRIERANRVPGVQCEDAAPAERAAHVLGTRGLLSVEPRTTLVRAAKGYDTTQPQGVEIRYAAPPTVTAAWFQRQLECHQADVVLGRLAARDDDPYVAPDQWLTLEVVTEGSALVVLVAADGHDATAQILDRARRLQRSQAR